MGEILKAAGCDFTNGEQLDIISYDSQIFFGLFKEHMASSNMSCHPTSFVVFFKVGLISFPFELRQSQKIYIVSRRKRQ